MPDQFHFLAPWWLLALIPLLLLAWRAYRPGGGDNPWRRVVDAALLPLLMRDHARTAVRAAPWLLGVAWTVAVLALANPTWERLPQRVYQTSAARVVVLDLSRTMDATDLPPSRLARARYRIEDILALSTEGQTGLVAYAGDAFTVAPLTRDANTVAALLRALDPGIMPVDGSRADLGLLKAAALLRQAGSSDGQVLLITDGIDADQTTATQRAAADLRREGYRVSVLGVVAPTTAPVAAAAATSSKQDDATVAARDTTALQSVARDGGGEYQPITASGDALKHLLDDPALLHGDTATSDTAAQAWQARGPWLVLLLLPLAALSFRRNWLLGVMLLAAAASPPQTALASTWDDLWRRPDQQSAKALAAGDFPAAARLADDPARRGSAEYRLGDYDKAAQSFARGRGGDADYNRGNALAKLGHYDEAIAAYDKALQADAANEDARANKAAVERMRQQQHAQAAPQADKAKTDADKPPSTGGESASRESSNHAPEGKDANNAGKSNDAGEHAHDAMAKSDAASKPSERDKVGSQNPAPRKDQTGRNQFADAADRLAKERENQTAQDNPPDRQAKARDDARSSPGSSGETAGAARPGVNAKDGERAAASSDARPLESEEQMAAEQWLRRIPDDPGGLLRRKFLYQYRQRAQRDGGER